MTSRNWIRSRRVVVGTQLRYPLPARPFIATPVTPGTAARGGNRTLASMSIVEELRRFTTPSVANGIETFDHRGRHEGFMDARVRCMFPDLGPLVAYAATATIRASTPGESKDRALWAHVYSLPEPRVVV